MKSHYELLEVSPHASQMVIRAAYRCLAQHDHPDKNPESDEARSKMTDINLAYAVLSNVQKRQKYDLVQGTTPRSYDRRGPGSMSHSGRQSDGTGPSTERPFAFRPIS